MNKKRIIINSILLSCLFALVLVNFNGFLFNKDNRLRSQKDNNIEVENVTVLKTSANSKIITINNNFDLNKTAVSGNGTLSNPYIIEDLTIDGNGSSYCVLINNTDKYFVIMDCSLFNASYGIYLNNVTYGMGDNVFISDINNSGIFLKDSFNSSIQNSGVYYSNNNGISLEKCTNITIINNVVSENKNAGIYANNSFQLNITNNQLNYNLYPIYLWSTNNSFIVNNNGVGNVYDLIQINCKSNYVKDNNLIDILIIRNTDEEKNENSILNLKIDFTLILLIIGCVFFFILIIIKVKKVF